MSNEICWLITVLYEAHHTLIRCAVKAECDAVPSVCVEYPMEVESREILHSFLPRDISDCGPIVAVEIIAEVVVVDTTPRAGAERLHEKLQVAVAALTRLRDCDWVITPSDRMDAVRDIAKKALEEMGAVANAATTGGGGE